MTPKIVPASHYLILLRHILLHHRFILVYMGDD